MNKMNEIKDELNQEIAKNVIKNLKSNYGDYAFSTYEFLNDNVLDKYSIGELTDRTS